ncbi:hypothetical protein T4D_2729 [Trichinella pseudospiralis]|uniref:Uncharacterized protein n=1 Tax=Trichinella pseudospiralis TaxID=6337 RepID=A0A0V1DPN1_TRIPS|nr:hypothetical protein T4D_2729 [Trichinella pseudospiralis]
MGLASAKHNVSLYHMTQPESSTSPRNPNLYFGYPNGS